MSEWRETPELPIFKRDSSQGFFKGMNLWFLSTIHVCVCVDLSTYP